VSVEEAVFEPVEVAVCAARRKRKAKGNVGASWAEHLMRITGAHLVSNERHAARAYSPTKGRRGDRKATLRPRRRTEFR
jgi:hypothetical protein